MKINNLSQIIENAISSEVKKLILEETEGKEYYHVMMDGEPIETFENHEDAEQYVMDNKEKHKGKELLIDKKKYGSYEEMIDTLDEMGEKLEQTENIDMKKKINEDYMESEMYEDDMSPHEKYMMSAGEEGGDDGSGQDIEMSEDFDERVISKYLGPEEDLSEEGAQMCSECGGMLNEEGMCSECGGYMMEETGMCSECGNMLNEEGMCSECGGYGMNESKKRKLILKESELVELIQKMVMESIPGALAAKNSRDDSGKENKKYYDEVGQKMKDYLAFEGNDNPEFPHQIGKGEKVARQNTTEEDDIVAKNFAGLQNLEYDIEPSEKFKERLKMAIEGDSKMGNGVMDKNSKKELSNSAKIGDAPEQKHGNQIKTDTAKKMQKQMKNREEDKKKRKIYKKENVPVSTADAKDDGINENKAPKGVFEEIQKMRRLTNYDKRTQ